MTPEKMGW